MKDEKDPSVQLTSSKPSIEDFFNDFLMKLKALNIK